MDIRRIPVALCLLPFILYLSGCGVKEDRDDCPCTVLLDLSSVRQSHPEDLLLVFSSSEGFVLRDTLPGDAIPDEYRLQVPRTDLAVDIYSPLSQSFGVSFAGMAIGLGEDCPRLYMYTGMMDTNCESVRRGVSLYKNYCVLEMKITSSGQDRFPFTLAVKGTVDGYSAGGGLSLGEFETVPLNKGDNSYSVSLPRQTDASLTLEIRERDGVLRTFAIGEYILDSGYDWNAPDLEDLTLEVDYAKTSVSLKINAWSVEIPYSVVI